MGARLQTGRASSATGYLLTEEIVDFVFATGGDHSVVGGDSGARRYRPAYAANGSPAHPNAAASNERYPKGDHQGMDHILLVDGVDGLVGRRLDAEDPGEPPD